MDRKGGTEGTGDCEQETKYKGSIYRMGINAQNTVREKKQTPRDLQKRLFLAPAFAGQGETPRDLQKRQLHGFLRTNSLQMSWKRSDIRHFFGT
jgi:hypothetical protein